MHTNWNTLRPVLFDSIQTTIYMVTITLLIGGVLGLILGIFLYGTGKGRILTNRPAYILLNLFINIVRPIPFVILVAALGPFTLHFLGTTIGTNAAIFVMVISATAAIARIVEQNLVGVDPGLIEAARSLGASTPKIITSVLVPEALGTLILGYTFTTVGIVDMSAMAGTIGGGGLGDFAINYGYNQFQWQVTLAATVIIIILVQLIQFVGSYYARKILRR